MSRMNVLLLTLLAWLSASAAVVTTTSRPAPKSDSWNNNRLVWTRNIFSRDRKSAMPTTTSRPHVAQTQEQSLVLTGIVLQDCGQVAFFEDTRVGETTRACAGQSLASGDRRRKYAQG